MKPAAFLTLVLALSAAALPAGEVKKFTVNADNWAEGEVPKEVFVVDGTIKIAAKDGNKAIMVDPSPITDASAQIAESAAGEATIQAKIFASKKGRSYPRFGLSVHGMSGHRLMLNVARKQLEIIKNDEVLATAPFTWTTDTWVKMKLEARKKGEDWAITGKAWPADGAEPADPQIKHADKGLKGQGKAAIWATPFSEMPVFFDDIEVAVETAQSGS